MEKTDILDNFALNLIFKGKCIYYINTMFEYREEEDNEGDIHESYDAEEIYRLIEYYHGDDENNIPCYSYYVLQTTIGGTMENETEETIHYFQRYEKIEDAIEYIEKERLQYFEWDSICYGVHKIREDVQEITEKNFNKYKKEAIASHK